MIDQPFILFSAGQFVATLGNRQLVDPIRNAVVDFLTEQTKNLGKQELANRIVRLRSDAALAQQIQKSIERAAKRWSEDYSDRELVSALAVDTSFADLPSVHNAIHKMIQNPFNPILADVLRAQVSDVLPNQFDARRVESGMASFLEILREELVGISELRGIFSLVAEIQIARSTQKLTELTTLLPRIESLLIRLEHGPMPTDQTLRDYLIWVMDQHRYLDPRGTTQTIRQVQVRLDEIFVTLDARPEPKDSWVDRQLLEDEFEIWMKRDDLSPREKQSLRVQFQNPLAYSSAPYLKNSIELVDLARQAPQLVVLGDPGSGKTTLLRYLAFRHAEALSSEQTSTNQLGRTRLPIYMRLAQYAEHGNGRSLGEFLAQAVQGESNSDQTLAVLIMEHLAQGECLVLLDGFDEVIDPTERSRIADQIDRFIRTYAKTDNHFIVTSRVAGYRMSPLAGDLPHHRIQDMNDKQIRRFIYKWCFAVERHQTPDLSAQALVLKTQRELDGIQRALAQNPGVRQLATNPLLLRIIASIHRTGARLPQRRIELYRMAADTLIRTWELARGIPETALIREADADQCLAELAAWMHETKPTGIASEGEVESKLAVLLGRIKGKEPEHPDIQTAVKDFLSRIRQHTGLFVERAPRRYGFMHLTFEEYFAARWLVGKPREMAQRIRMRLHQPRWEEPILLAIGFYGMQFPEDVTELIEEAILGKGHQPSPYEDILHRDLFFALRCLGEQDAHDTLRSKMINQTLALWLNPEFHQRSEPLVRRIGHVLHTIQDSLIGKEFEQALVSIVRNKSAFARNMAMQALSRVLLSSDAVDALLSAGAEADIEIRNSARMALENATLSPEAVAILSSYVRKKTEPAHTLSKNSLKKATIAYDATHILCATLRDKSSVVRSSAAIALGNTSLNEDAIAELEIALHDDDPLVRACAAHALGNAVWSPDVPLALTKLLNDSNAKVRLNAVESLSNTTLTGETVVKLLHILQDENKRVRNAGIETLTSASFADSAIAPLLNALKHPDPNIRATATTVLQNCVLSEAIVNALLESLYDPEKLVRECSASTLQNATLSLDAVNRLITIAGDRDEQVRESAIYALKNAPPLPSVFTVLLENLRDERNQVRASAANTLSSFTLSRETIDALLEILREGNSKIRASAAEVLGGTDLSPEVVAALLSALRDRSSSVRSIASGALGNATDSNLVVTALLEAVKDKNNRVRKNAVDALGTIATQDQVHSLLLNCLHDEDEKIRASVVFALRNSNRQPESVNAILEALADPSELVRAKATQALDQITIREDIIPNLISSLNHTEECIRMGVARMLGNANYSDTVCNALLDKLQDSNRVSVVASHSLVRLARQSAARLTQDLANCLAEKANQLSQREEASSEIRNNIFIALEAVAPSPCMD